MPPEKAKRQPTAELRKEVDRLDRGASASTRRSGTRATPARSRPRRLSNAEYDYTIRDLTGVDIRPTREFPVDPANEAGLRQLGRVAGDVAGPAEEVPRGGPAGRRPPRPEAGRVRLRPAPGRHRHRPRQVLRAGGSSTSTSGSRPTTPTTSWPPGGSSTAPPWASRRRRWPTSPPRRGISPKYLATVWSALTEHAEEVGPIAALQALWRELPPPDGSAAGRRPGRLRADARLRRRAPPAARAGGQEPDRAAGSTTARSRFVLWKNRQYRGQPDALRRRRAADPGPTG